MGFFSQGFSGQPEHLRAHQQLLEQSLPHVVFEGGNTSLRAQVSVGQGQGDAHFQTSPAAWLRGALEIRPNPLCFAGPVIHTHRSPALGEKYSPTARTRRKGPNASTTRKRSRSLVSCEAR